MFHVLFESTLFSVFPLVRILPFDFILLITFYLQESFKVKQQPGFVLLKDFKKVIMQKLFFNFSAKPILTIIV